MIHSAPEARALTRRLAGANSLLIVSLVLSAFFALWLTDLGYPSLSGDESFVAILASQPTSAILQRLNSDEPHPLVYYLLMRAWQKLFGGRPELIVRLPSLLIGLILLSLTYRLGREMGLGHWPALLSMILLGSMPQIVTHLREARMYGPMVASVAAVMLIAWRFERLPPRRAVWIAAAVSLLALMTHYFNALFVGTLGVWGTLTLKKDARRQWLLSQAIAWGVLALWLPTMGRGFFNSTSLSQGKTWSFTLPPWGTLAQVVDVGVFGYRDRPDAWLFIIGGLLLVGGWLIGSLSSRGRTRSLLLMGVAVPLIVYALISWFKPVFHPKYTQPWLLLAALAIGQLIARRPRLGTIVNVGLLAVMLGPMVRTVQLPYDPGLTVSRNEWLRPGLRQLSAGLIEWVGPSDVFGLGTPDPAHCYYADYYFDRQLGCALIPQYPDQPVDELAQQLDDLLKQHAVLWYLDYYNPSWDPAHVADAALARAAVSLGADEIGGSRLRLYTSPQMIACAQHLAGARFGDAAELTGVWGVRGSALHVALNWRALADHPLIEAKVFIHVVDGTGQMVTQDDSVPVNWTRPLPTWQRDEHLLDIHTLLLPANAEVDGWSIRIGWYDAATGVRLPAFDRTGGRWPDDEVVMPLADILGVAACAR